jgi:predicted O-methyltransferase YrrM
MLEYYLYRSRRDRWGGPFNGQRGRLALVDELFGRLEPHYVVETGTYRGTTAAWFARRLRSRLVYTVEFDARSYGFARCVLRGYWNVYLRCGDSREFLRDLLRRREILSGRGFFYLDAHWGHDLPLVEETDAILSQADRSLICIDDFAVPGEPNYGVDDYGPGRRLDASLVQPLLDRYGAAIFYPAMPAMLENGARRGCCVIARDEELIGALRSIPLLRT